MNRLPTEPIKANEEPDEYTYLRCVHCGDKVGTMQSDDYPMHEECASYILRCMEKAHQLVKGFSD